MRLRRVYWICFVAALAVYGTMILWTLPGIQASAGGLIPFDMRPGGYSVAEGRAFLEALGPEGRALYEGPQRLLDLFYPALLAVVLIGAVLTFFQSRVLRVVLIAVTLAGMAGDYTENHLIAGLLAGDITDGALAAASRATLVKSSATSVAMLVVGAGLLRGAIRKWRSR